MNSSVLCIDDEPSMLGAYRCFLRSDYDVVTTAGCREALTVLAERGPLAVVISDLQMPGMDGVLFLSTIRELYPDTVRAFAG